MKPIKIIFVVLGIGLLLPCLWIRGGQNHADEGKRTYAWLENASNIHLSIASGCDKVLIADFGGVDMPSMAMQSMFGASKPVKGSRQPSREKIGR